MLDARHSAPARLLLHESRVGVDVGSASLFGVCAMPAAGPPVPSPLPRPLPHPALPGRSSGRLPAPGRLDRAAFELAVADAAELLQAQLRWAGHRRLCARRCVLLLLLLRPALRCRRLSPTARLLCVWWGRSLPACMPCPTRTPLLLCCSTVEAHCQEPALRAAILRSYAVQAIATFADAGAWYRLGAARKPQGRHAHAPRGGSGRGRASRHPPCMCTPQPWSNWLACLLPHAPVPLAPLPINTSRVE